MDITDDDIKRAMKAFGEDVKAKVAARQETVIARLREEIARVRPFTARLLQEKVDKDLV